MPIGQFVMHFASIGIIDTNMVAKVKECLVEFQNFLFDVLQGGVMVLERKVLVSDPIRVGQQFTSLTV